MAAVISVCQQSGIGYSSTVVAKNEFYFLPIDSNTETPDDWPLQIPDTGTNYSYEVWLFFRCDVAPSQYCKNFKIWCDGNVPTGMKITINSNAILTYNTPINTESITGNRVDLSNYTESNKLSVSGELNNIGDKTSYVVFQLEITSAAEQGTYEDFTIFYQYDEV